MSEDDLRTKEVVAVVNNSNEVVEPAETDTQESTTNQKNEKSYFTRLAYYYIRFKG